ncbi:MAG: DUF2207 domain-containing protein [Eubacterium sp.]
MKKTLFAAILLWGILFFCSPFFSSTICASSDNSIGRIDMDVSIDTNGTAHIREIWKTSVHQGTEGYRPYGNMYSSEITDFSVSDDLGNHYELQDYWNTGNSFGEKAGKCGIIDNGNQLELCWGITEYGERTYTLTYNITNIINQYTDAQGLYFSFIPEQMNQKPQNVSVFIHTDLELSESNAKIWSFGYPNGTITFENGGVRMDSLGSLPSSHYMTALIRFPDHTFSTAVDQGVPFGNVYEQATEDAITPATIRFYDYLIFAIPFVLLLGSFVIWFIWGHDDTPVDVLEFYPPDGHNSAEIALLYNGKVTNEDLTSMIVYLASKGYLSIEEKTEEAMFGLIKSHDFVLRKLKDYDGINSIEQRFFDGLFAGRTMVSKSMLTNKFYRILGDIADDMNSKDNQKIIFESSSLSKRLPITLMILLSLMCGLVRSLYAAEGDLETALFLSIFPTVALLVLTQLLSKLSITNKIFLIIWSLGFGLSAVIAPLITLAQAAPFFLYMLASSIACSFGMAFFRYLVPKRTPYGTEMLGRIKGFKHFLEIADKERLEMLVHETPSYFYDILPYTYVLGVSDKWIDNFEDIAIEPAHWYHGSNIYSTRAFATSLNSTMASARTAMTSSPSSGSGGHGFSGGGGGAGGHSSGGGFR